MQISFTITVVVYELKSHCNPRWASNSPDSSHSFHSTASSSFPAKITWCNLHAPSRCRGWWMPPIHTRPSQIQHKRTFITGDNHSVLFYTISSCTDPVNLFRFSFDVRAEKQVYYLVLHHIVYFEDSVIEFQCSMFASFCFYGAEGIQLLRVGSNLPSLWLCKALCQTIIFCIAICRLPLPMTDILNRMSRPHNNKQAHSWVRSPPFSSGLEWNNICLLHQGIVYPLPIGLVQRNEFQPSLLILSSLSWPLVWQLRLIR